MRIIGAADEFWRLRLTRIDTTEGLDFEWHDDILYREPTPDMGEEVEVFGVEAVRLDDYDAVVRLASFAERAAAQVFFERAREDLSEMTKAQFEESYLAPAMRRAGSEDAREADDTSLL